MKHSQAKLRSLAMGVNIVLFSCVTSDSIIAQSFFFLFLLFASLNEQYLFFPMDMEQEGRRGQFQPFNWLEYCWWSPRKKGALLPTVLPVSVTIINAITSKLEGFAMFVNTVLDLLVLQPKTAAVCRIRESFNSSLLSLVCTVCLNKWSLSSFWEKTTNLLEH